MSSSWNDLGNKFHREFIETSNQKGLSPEEAKVFYNNEEYETYFVEYVGDFVERINSLDYAELYIVRTFFALLFVKNGRISELLNQSPEIINIERSFPFTLFNLNISKDKPDLNALNKGSTTLNGEGVIVGIVGTGIDYLNPRFMDENGDTRIVAIWDQSISDGFAPEGFMFGKEYDRNQINKAIEAKAKGADPYEIVNHRDEEGYGTAIANIIGGRQLEEGDEIISIAPHCEFIIVKLKEGSKSNLNHWGLENYAGFVYDSNDVFSSGSYLYKMQQKLDKPVAMYLPVGTNLGAHDGSTLGERYFSLFSQVRKFSVNTSTGDQGGSPICLKDSFSKDENEKSFYINVDENQNNIFFSLNYFHPDIINVGITSPNGETINKIDIKPIDGEEVDLKLGESTIKVQYFLEGKTTTNKRLDFVIKNALGGIWAINVTKVESIQGNFNIWLQQWQFSIGKTGLLKATQDTTLMTPATSEGTIVTSSYNQIDGNLMEESGRGFTTDNRIIPTIASSAKNILTVGLNNEPIVVSGAAVSGAILAGVVALLYQWGIVEKNDINMYEAKIKSYLIQGTVREENNIYPNSETGFGVLSIEKLFNKLEKRYENKTDKIDKSDERFDSKQISNIYVNIPKEIYNNLKKSESLRKTDGTKR